MQLAESPKTSFPRPCWPPTETGWSNYKPLIARLYIENDLKLDNLRSVLEIRHGFKASERMYKARFKRWKLRKYFSARDKEAVAQLLDLYRRKGVKAPEITLNGARVPLHAIRRHCRSRNIFHETCDILPYVPQKQSVVSDEEVEFLNIAQMPSTYESSPARSTIAYHRLATFGTAPSPFLETEFDIIQNILKLTSQYFKWHFGTDLTEEQFSASKRPSAISWRNLSRLAMRASLCQESIGRGLELLIKGRSPEGWKSLHKGCAMVKPILQEQHRGLLKLIYLLFSDDRWQNFPDIRVQILEFFSDMAVSVFGENHPLARIILLSKNPAVFQGPVRKVLQVLLDISRFHLVKDTTESDPLRRAQCDILRVNGDYTGAEKAAKALVSESIAVYGPNKDETRRALRRLAHVYLDQNRYNIAESIYLDVIVRGHRELGDDHLDESCIFSYKNLAYICDKRGDIRRAEAFWRMAYGGSVYLYGTRHYDTEYCKWSLAGILRRRYAMERQDWMLELPCTCHFEERLSIPAALLCGETASWPSHTSLRAQEER